MRPFDFAAPSDPGLLARLRAATADAHRRLEDDLDLLRPPLSRARFTAVLERFLGFHLAWEPAVGRFGELAPLMAGRSRLGQLRADLSALGRTEAEIDATPRCEAAAGLAPNAAAALGSLYVIEGSTLGGQVISRALADAPWLPPGGLTAFNPYGARTGAMWAVFRGGLEAEADPEGQAERAAVATFELLQGWLTEARS